MSWTAADIPDLSELVVIVTGANSGLGLETTRALAGKGAKVIMACRSPSKAEAARASLIADGIPEHALELRPLDLASLASIRSFAAGILAEYPRVDRLINNAGVMALPYRETADGFEMQIGTNHLGHFALTGLLLERLLASPTARVVTVSSLMHRIGRIRLDDLSWQRGYRRWPAYGQSKLANLLFGYELQRRAEARGHALLSLAAHPGYAATNLPAVGVELRGATLAGRIYAIGNTTLAQDAAAGALPTLYAATAAEVAPGDYFGPAGAMQMRGAPTRVQAMPKARDPEIAAKLWALSTELTGVRFDPI
jgi:NAD(P)-dependent dehydrogenase (short-subunit alcohol dehydrogenase family)